MSFYSNNRLQAGNTIGAGNTLGGFKADEDGAGDGKENLSPTFLGMN